MIELLRHMNIEIRINDLSGTKKHTNYIGWGPRPAWIRQVDGLDPLQVFLKNNGSEGGGLVTFFPADSSGDPDMYNPTEELRNLTLTNTGNPDDWVKFFIAGAFVQYIGEGFASSRDRDTGIGVYDARTNNLLSTTKLMVRVRKNANYLTDDERRDFLEAIMYLNTNQGSELPWKNFQDMHVGNTSTEIHGRSCFLPWHRAYLINLERVIQSVEIQQANGNIKTYAHVTIPYWDFFKKAENLFSKDFLGFADATGIVQFNPSNPLVNWSTNLSVVAHDILLGPKLRRSHKLYNMDDYPWDPQQTASIIYTTNDANWRNFNRTEEATLHDFSDYERFALTGGRSNRNKSLEGTPHGAAHISWGGPLMDSGYSPADPLFFMLHCNIDRLWAKWQWLNNYRFDSSDVNSYDRQGTGNPGPSPSAETFGNYTEDTMWPWNGDDQPPRPKPASWGELPDSPCVSAPGGMPKVEQMIDFHGQHSQNPNDQLGFDYHDVPLDYPEQEVV